MYQIHLIPQTRKNAVVSYTWGLGNLNSEQGRRIKKPLAQGRRASGIDKIINSKSRSKNLILKVIDRKNNKMVIAIFYQN